VRRGLWPSSGPEQLSDADRAQPASTLRGDEERPVIDPLHELDPHGQVVLHRARQSA